MTPVPGLPKINNFCKRMFVLILLRWFSFSGIAFADTTDNAWVVQLGPFKKQENARGFINKIKKKGYIPFIVGVEKSDWYKTLVGPYPSKLGSRSSGAGFKKAQGITAIVLAS